MGKFGLGQPVLRSEDFRFLTGTGRYTADISLPDQAYAVVLRSPHAHADLVHVDGDAAQAMPGVRLVVTQADLAADALGDIPCAVPVRGRNGQPLPRPGRPLLARGRVRFAGEPVAMVVADSEAAARDACEAIRVEYRPLPAFASIEAALAGGASAPIWERATDNIAFFWERGDEQAVEQTLTSARHVVRLHLVNNRVVPCPMEPRAALGAYDAASERFTLVTGSQGAHAIRDQICRATLKIAPERLRVITPDVGGGFGLKIFHYPEEALVLWAAHRLGRPVKWVGERAEAFSSDTHGRDQRNRVAAAFAADGRCQALRVDTLANMGAYLNQFGPAIPAQATGGMLSGCYAIPRIYASCRGVYSNTVPVDAYRGAGRPEATYVVERLMDTAARQLGLGRDEIRRRNFIRPEQMPYRTASGPTYDCGDFARNLDDALAIADWAGFEARRAEARERGQLRGIGLSSYVEVCGFEEEEATLICGADGAVELLIGTQSTGQGHETAYAQIAAERLGLDFAQVRVLQGDTDRIRFGRGTGGSRSLPVGGPAVRQACDALIARGEPIARALLQADEKEPMTFADGGWGVTGSGQRVGIAEVARALAAGEVPHAKAGDPAGTLIAGGPAGSLSATAHFRIEASTFPNGTHVCEVEVDEQTGLAHVVAYHVVDDFGTIVNPNLLKGQILGGVAQGIGQALFEHAVYENGTAQLLTGSFVDYGLPRAEDVPSIEPRYNPVPCTTNPLGIKGAGEAGAIAACPAVVNAVLDALAPLGVTHVDMPLTPETLWRAMTEARTGTPAGRPPAGP